MKTILQRICFVLLLVPAWGYAQLFGNEDGVLAIKHTTDFQISGAGDAPSWETTHWIPLEKRKGVSVYPTQAKLLYSDTGIYGLFSCKDSKITSTLKKDFADLWTEDVIEIFLWPDQSIPLYFEYELSPMNYELPILVPNLEGDFFGWKPWVYEGTRKTRHATKIIRDSQQSPTGWIAEFFIPYALLKPLQNVPPEKGTQWRMNLYRLDYDQEYTSWSWKPIQKNFHDYRLFGTIRFE